MADIRINSLSTTASASSSDDFLPIDGATNGTRKLNAYSPTFGGNLTVSGTATVTGQINGSAGYQFRGATGTTYELLRYVGGTNNPGIFATVNESTKKATIFASGSLVSGQTLGLGAEGSEALTIGAANATLAGNLTVSGGTITGGTSGLSLASGGTDQNITLTPSGTGSTIIAGSNSAATFGGSTAVSIIRNTNATAGAFNTLFFVNKDNFGSAIIATKQTNNGNNGDNLHFVTKQNPGASWNTGMVLTTNDNLLIGTTTDGGQKLQVNGNAYIGSATTSTNILTVQGNGPNTTHQAGTSTAALWNRWLNSAGTRRGYYGYATGGDSTFTIMNEENGSFVLGTNATTALTLDASQNATFAGTGTSGFAGNLNIKGALGAHQTAALNLAYEGSSVSQLVAYGADASTLGRVNVILRKAGTGTDAVTGLSVRDFGIITQGGVAQTPASASATGTAGTIQWDASYIYVCTATNTWKRVAIATW